MIQTDSGNDDLDNRCDFDGVQTQEIQSILKSSRHGMKIKVEDKDQKNRILNLYVRTPDVIYVKFTVCHVACEL